MRLKNATFVQKHIEKIILLLGVLFLIVVLAVFMGGVFNPYRVELGNKEYEQPAEVIPALSKDADRLQTALQKGDQIPADYIPPDMENNYRIMLAHPVTTVDALATNLSQRGTPISQLEIKTPPPPKYMIPNPPMPTGVAWSSGFAVLDMQFAPNLNQEFAALWGGTRIPADFNYVVVEGEFSLWDWVLALQGESGQTGKIPSGIWSKRLGVAGVYLIREELDEVTGRWGNRTIVKPLPGQVRVMPDEQHTDDPLKAQFLVEEIQGLEQFIARPDLPPLSNGDVLLAPKDELLDTDPNFNPGNFPGAFPPGAGLEGPGVNNQQPMTERQRLLLERRQQQEERRRQQRERRSQPGNQRPGGPGLEDFAPPGGPGGTDSRDLERQRQQEQRRQQQLQEEQFRQEQERQRQLREQQQREREQNQLRRPGAAGLDGFENPGGVPGGIPGLPGGVNIQADTPIRVWAADVTAEWGKTYRYKLAVSVINPLYGVPRLEAEQFEENKSRAAVAPNEEAIAAADWIEPVKIEPKFQFFFVGGGETRSRIEIWTIFNGQRIKQEFDVSAGDPIGGVVIRNLPDLGEREVNLSIGATVVDIEKRRDINGSTVYALIYIDNEGKLHERLQSDDQSNPERRKLEAQLREQQREREDRQRLDQSNPGEFGLPGGPGNR